MMLYYFKTRKIKYFLDPLERLKDTNDRDYVYTHKCLSIPPGCDLDNNLVNIEQIE